MSARQKLLGWLLADAPAAPSVQDRAAISSASPAASQFGDTTARIGTYNTERVAEATFDKMMRHFQVRFGVAIRELLLTAPDWSVKGPDPKVAAYVDAVLEQHRTQLVKACVRKGAMRGMAPFETVWEHAETGVSYTDEAGKELTESVPGYRLRKLKSIARGNIQSILVDGFEELVGFQVNQPSGVQLELAKGECFIFVHNPDDGNFWGVGDFVSAYEPWYRQQVTWDQWLRYTDRFSTPPTVVYHMPGKATDGSENADIARTIADGFMGSNATATMPLQQITKPDGSTSFEKGWDVEFKSVPTSASTDFKESLEYHDRAILRGVLVPDTVATQQANTGSLALSNTHMGILELIEDGLLDEILAAVNAQLVPTIVRATFGDVPLPTVSSVGLSGDKVSKLQAMLDKALEKGYWTSADWENIADTLGVPVAEAQEAEPTDGGAPVEGEQAAARDALVAMREAAQEVRLKLAAAVTPEA